MRKKRPNPIRKTRQNMRTDLLIGELFCDGLFFDEVDFLEKRLNTIAIRF